MEENLSQLRKIEQSELDYVFKSAQKRMQSNPEMTAKCQKLVNEHRLFVNADAAMQVVNKVSKIERYAYQIWGTIATDEEYYIIQAPYIVTNDNRIKQAAEYIGMAALYNA